MRARKAGGALIPLVLSLALAGSATAAGLTVKFTALPTYASRNQTITAGVTVRAGSTCTIVVTYRTTRSKAAGLVTKKANSAGRVSWSWKVGPSTTKGRWPVRVNCKLGSLTGTATRYFTVR